MKKHVLRAIILHEYRLKRSVRQAVASINMAHGPGTTSRTSVARWFSRFASGQTDLADRPRSGRPLELDDNQLATDLGTNPTRPLRKIAHDVGASSSTVHRHLMTLHYRRVLSQLTPHALSQANRNKREQICIDLLGSFTRTRLVNNLVTGDESWVLYDNRTRVASWLPRGQNPPMQPKIPRHVQKLLLCCFWDSKGMLFWELLPQGRTVDAQVYCRQLRALATVIRRQRGRRQTILLLHDNARPHVANVTRQQLQSLNIEVVPHPPYSPDIAPSDYHLFRHLKVELRNKAFTTANAVETALSSFFAAQPQTFWEAGISALPDRWKAVVDASGDYLVDA